MVGTGVGAGVATNGAGVATGVGSGVATGVGTGVATGVGVGVGATDTGPRAALTGSRHSDIGLQSAFAGYLIQRAVAIHAPLSAIGQAGRSASSATTSWQPTANGFEHRHHCHCVDVLLGTGLCHAPPLAVRRLPTTGVPEIVGMLKILKIGLRS